MDINLKGRINELGQDSTLLTRHDDWLETQRASLQGDLEDKATQLKAVLLAQRIKRALQQKNLVAVQQLIKSNDGDVVDIVINIMKLPDALLALRTETTELDKANAQAQIFGWDRDGYDTVTSSKLR